MRCPSSPGHGGESRPGSSFWNFLQNTLRPLLLPTMAGSLCDGCPQESAMPPIVVDLRPGDDRQFGIDRERQSRVRDAQRALDFVGHRAAGKDEPEVAGAFRKR